MPGLAHTHYLPFYMHTWEYTPGLACSTQGHGAHVWHTGRAGKFSAKPQLSVTCGARVKFQQEMLSQWCGQVV